MKDKAFSTFLDQNPPLELPEKGDFAFDKSLSRPMVCHRQECHQATCERQIAVAPLCILTVRLMCGLPLERMPRIVAGCDVTDPPSCVFAIDCFGRVSDRDQRCLYPWNTVLPISTGVVLSERSSARRWQCQIKAPISRLGPTRTTC